MPESDKDIVVSGDHNIHKGIPVGRARQSTQSRSKGKKQEKKRSPTFKTPFSVQKGRIRKKKSNPSTFLNPGFQGLSKLKEMTETRWDGFDANGFFGKGSSDAEYDPKDYLWVYNLSAERLSDGEDGTSTVPVVSNTQGSDDVQPTTIEGEEDSDRLRLLQLIRTAATSRLTDDSENDIRPILPDTLLPRSAPSQGFIVSTHQGGRE